MGGAGSGKSEDSAAISEADRSRGWNLRKVMLECPKCGRKQQTVPLRDEPRQCTLVRMHCPDCADEATERRFFNAYGFEINKAGRPI